jgi:DNA-binding transcriptional regulator YhcF (GntR family)
MNTYKRSWEVHSHQLHQEVRAAIEKLPSVPDTAYRAGVAAATVYKLHKRLPRQVMVLNEVLREAGLELTIKPLK